MPSCPVCEHTQAAGDSCEVCGHQLTEPGTSSSVPAGTLEGLEVTHWEEPFPEDPAPLDVLEQTALASVGVVALEPVADLEATRAPAVEVPLEPMMDIDLGRAPLDAPTPVPTGPMTCRYCKNTQASGAFCDRCGMRSPRLTPALRSSGAKAAPKEMGRCRRCSEKVLPGTRCGGCGMLAAESEV
jgi:hypothetical protein